MANKLFGQWQAESSGSQIAPSVSTSTLEVRDWYPNIQSPHASDAVALTPEYEALLIAKIVQAIMQHLNKEEAGSAG